MIKMLTIDLDGTLLRNDKTISNKTVETLQKAEKQGIKIVLASGRPIWGIRPYVERLNLELPISIVASNGCATYTSRDWSIANGHFLTETQVNKLLTLSEEHPRVALVLQMPSRRYVYKHEVSDVVARDAKTHFQEVTMISAEALAQLDEPILLGLFMGEADKLDQVQTEIEPLLTPDFHTVRGLDYCFEAMPHGVSKAKALADLAKDCGILPEEVMAFGDAVNDLEMFAWAGMAVAMANASAKVQSQADLVTLSNEQDGVADAVQRFVLKE